MMKLIDVERLAVEINVKGTIYKVVNNVSFSLSEGQVLGIVGESGCGKSMTAYGLQGLLPTVCKVSSGTVKLKNQKINLNDKNMMTQLRKKDFSMIFQNSMSCLNPLHKIGMQIEEALPLNSLNRKKQVYSMMDEVQLKNVKSLYEAYPHQLSGGMRQRVMIAMALIKKPIFLIADEPTTSLDVTTESEILSLMLSLVKKYSTALVFISHDLSVVKTVSDQVAIMYAGEFVEYGETKEIFNLPKHPYTKGLLSSIPKPKDKGNKLLTIEGSVPALENRTLGRCMFHNRCQFVKNQCLNDSPPMRLDGAQLVKCHFAGAIDE